MQIKPCPGTILGDLPFLTLFLDLFTPGTPGIVAVGPYNKSCDLLCVLCLLQVLIVLRETGAH